MAEEDELSPDEIQELSRYMDKFPKPEEKHGIFSFFHKILETSDTSKAGNVDEELNSVRIMQSTALYAKEMNLDLIKDYLNKEAEILLATSLSKKGFLVKALITTKKEMKAYMPSEKKKKSGWFSKKEEGGVEE
jgi:hypothetical protein